MYVCECMRLDLCIICFIVVCVYHLSTCLSLFICPKRRAQISVYAAAVLLAGFSYSPPLSPCLPLGNIKFVPFIHAHTHTRTLIHLQIFASLHLNFSKLALEMQVYLPKYDLFIYKSAYTHTYTLSHCLHCLLASSILHFGINSIEFKFSKISHFRSSISYSLSLSLPSPSLRHRSQPAQNHL